MAQDARSVVSRPSASGGLALLISGWSLAIIASSIPCRREIWLPEGTKLSRAGTKQAIFLSATAIPVILEILRRLSVICASVASPAPRTREGTCRLRPRKRFQLPAHLKPDLREAEELPAVSLRRRFWPPSTSQPVSISRPIASSGSTNSSPSISRDCPISKLSGPLSVMAPILCPRPTTWSSGCLAACLEIVKSRPDYHPPWRWRPVCS